MNTNIKVQTYSNLSSFMRRISHNNREKSLDNLDMINDSNIDKDYLENFKKRKKDSKNLKTRSDLSNEISKLRYKFKNSKKQTTRDRIQNKIENLILERDQIVDKNKSPKVEFVELTFSITSMEEEFKKDKNYGKDFNNIVENYVKKTFPNLDIVSVSVHYDQSKPHIHINGIYEDGTLTHDLDNSIGRSEDMRNGFHYSNLQKDFNNEIKSQENFLNKHKLKIGDITTGGKKDYLHISTFKKLEKNIRKYGSREVDKFVSDFLKDNKGEPDKIKNLILNLKENLKEAYTKQLISEKLPLKYPEELQRKERENQILQEELEKILTGGKKVYKKLLEEKKTKEETQKKLKDSERIIQDLKETIDSRNRHIENIEEKIDLEVK